MKETTLHATHTALGAKMVPFAGWSMPVQYGPILGEAHQVRTKAGLFDLGHMGRVHVSGPDTVPFLDRICSNFVGKIPVGSIRYSLFCRENGFPIDDLLVYREEDAVYLVINAANTDEDLSWMRQHADGFDVTIDDRTDATAMLALQGPGSPAILDKIASNDLSSLGYYKWTRATVCGLDDVHVSRTGYTGEIGYELTFPTEAAPEVWNAILAAGGDEIQPIGLGARDVLRLEAGMALYGHEIDAEHHGLEAGLSFAISFKEEKGDWIGKEALLAAKESPTRRLVGITTPGPRIPRQGQLLFAGDVEVGVCCSGAKSPTLDTNIASAFVQLGHDTPETELEIDFRGKRQPCKVQDLPFYSRTRN